MKHFQELGRFLLVAVGISASVSLQPLKAQAQSACELVFAATSADQTTIYADLDLSEKISAVVKLTQKSATTTSLRREDKFVSNATVVNQLLSDLQTQFGTQFELRDIKVQGQKNVTVSKYFRPMKFYDSDTGRFLIGKLRLRKYFSAFAEDEAGAPAILQPVTVKPAASAPGFSTATHSFLEFKIDDPIYDNSVDKPRFIISDADAMILQSPSAFKSESDRIYRDAIANNPDLDPELARHILDVVSDLDNVQSEAMLTPYLQTSYVRDSYSLRLKDTANPNGPPVEVQITIDREIQLSDLRSAIASPVSVYDDADYVVEVKVPVAFSKLTDADIRRVPGLAAIKAAKTELDVTHNHRFAVGSGKLSNARRSLVNELD